MTPQPAPTDTKEKILDAAERLFADHGFAATSVRAITTEAGVNLAALNYHFGSKEALVGAVFRRRLDPVGRERLRRLEDIELGSDTPSLEEVLEAFLAPALRALQDSGQGGRRLVKLVGRAFSEPDPRFELRLLQLFEETFSRYLKVLHRAVPHLTRDEVFWRLHFVVGAMGHTMAHTLWHVAGRDELAECPSYQRLVPQVENRRLDVGMVLSQLIPFAAAGLRAPSGQSEPR